MLRERERGRERKKDRKKERERERERERENYPFINFTTVLGLTFSIRVKEINFNYIEHKNLLLLVE